MAQGQIGSGLQQLNISGVEQQQASGLAQDIGSLFGSVSKSVETYNTIGDTAAKIDARDRIASANKELANWKLASVGQDDNIQFQEEYASRVHQISGELVASKDNYKNHKSAYDAYDSTTIDYTSSIEMNLIPSIAQKHFTALGNNFDVKTREASNLAVSVGVPETMDIIKTNSAIASTYNLKPSVYVDNTFSNTMDIGLTDVKSSPKEFGEKYKVIDKSTGLYDKTSKKRIVDAVFGSYATMDKDGNLIPSEGASYTTNEHLEKIAGFIAETERLYTPDGITSHNPFAMKINGDIASGYATLDTGIVPIKKALAQISENNKELDILLDKDKTQLSESEYRDVLNTQIEGDIVEARLRKAGSVIDSAVGDSAKLTNIATNGMKVDIIVKDRTGMNKPKTMTVTIKKDQVANILQSQIAVIEGGIINAKTKQVDKAMVTGIVSVIKATNGGSKSGVLENATDMVMVTGTAPSIKSKKELLDAIEIEGYAIMAGLNPTQFKSAMDSQAYLQKLRIYTANIVDDPSDKNNLTKMSAAFQKAKEQALTIPNTAVTLNKFKLVNRPLATSHYDDADNLSLLNKYMGLGNSMPISAPNMDTFTEIYKRKYPTSEKIDFGKMDDLIKENSHYIGGSVFFGSENVILPLITTVGGGAVTNYQIMDTLTPQLKMMGVENLTEAKDVTFRVSYQNGVSMLHLMYYDKDGHQYKEKVWTGDEIAKHKQKEPTWYGELGESMLHKAAVVGESMKPLRDRKKKVK